MIPPVFYPMGWWKDALMQFGDRRQAHDTVLRSIYSAVFSWSLLFKQPLEKIVDFAAKRIASFCSGSGYWEYLLTTHYGFDIECHDMKLHNRFTPMKQIRHSEATVDPQDAIFLHGCLERSLLVLNSSLY